MVERDGNLDLIKDAITHNVNQRVTKECDLGHVHIKPGIYEDRINKAWNLLHSALDLRENMLKPDFNLESEITLLQNMQHSLATKDGGSKQFITINKLVDYMVLIHAGLMEGSPLVADITECWKKVPAIVRDNLSKVTIGDITTTPGIKEMIENCQCTG